MIRQYFFDRLVEGLVEYQKLFHIEHRARYSGDTVGAENASVNRRLEWRGYRVLMDAADAFGFNTARLLDEANLKVADIMRDWLAVFETTQLADLID